SARRSRGGLIHALSDAGGSPRRRDDRGAGPGRVRDQAGDAARASGGARAALAEVAVGVLPAAIAREDRGDAGPLAPGAADLAGAALAATSAVAVLEAAPLRRPHVAAGGAGAVVQDVHAGAVREAAVVVGDAVTAADRPDEQRTDVRPALAHPGAAAVPEPL